jgi:hypothetical protein
MNEQLLKIAKQAGLTLSVDQQVAFQRAAELIVRECAEIGERYANGNYEVYNQIMTHFGLEEE